MTETDNRIRVEGAKLTIDTLPRGEISPVEIVDCSIGDLLKSYSSSGRKEFLDTALIQVIAWLELGLEYGMLEDVFDKVLQMSFVEKEEFLLKHVKSGGRMKITRHRIEVLVGRWRRGEPGDLNFKEVVDDIYDRMRQAEDCFCNYICHYADGSIYGMHELFISRGRIILHDVKQRKYYFFEGD